MASASPSSLKYEHVFVPQDGPSSSSSSWRCSKCNVRQNPNSRNLVVCIDGTSNQFGQNNTNIVKLYAKIDLETDQPKQFAYYSSGIGTRPKSLHVFNRMERAISDKFDMAVAWNMEEIVKDAYGWLARTYQEGDQIYLFGFSRGAYQVRVLAGMIHEVGLIRTPTEKQIGTAWDHYHSIRSGKPKPRQIAREFKNTFSWKDLRVHFVGVWDTVSSVGLVRGDVFLSTSASAAHACHFRHALALDERRVKFMPEYFHEMNSQTDDEANNMSKYIVAHLDSTQAQSPCTECSTSSSESKKAKATEIKEVWFAGSHSDVGGRNRPGKSHQAGNVSLLWMRREASANGLVLKPTDIVWVPDDLDFGTSNSMTKVWKMIEYLPIKQQVSFSGAGDNARRLHRLQPRRIIPGQKVHASILFANAYKPQATLGEGFDIPIVQARSADTELDNEIWETGLFDNTAARELVAYLGGQQGVAPIYLDRLLFMLRFKEGRECVRQVPDWREKFENLIYNRTGLVRLVTVVAYFEAAYDGDASPSNPITPINLPQSVFTDAKSCFGSILASRKHRDCPRVVALLRPLTRHRVLRQQILMEDVLKTFIQLLDQITLSPGGNFAQAMDGLNCLLTCEDLQQSLIRHLGTDSSARLLRMLDVPDSHHLTACLRVVVTVAQIEQARNICTPLKPRLRELAGERENLAGMLAIEALLALFDPNEQAQLDAGLRNTNFRANLASTLVRLNPDNNRSSSNSSNEHNGYQILRHLFGLDASELSASQKNLIGELKSAIEKGKSRERTAATMTLLKLCETAIIRTYLLEINIMEVFINQLQLRTSSLLAAYALATCLKYVEMKDAVKDNEDLPKYIVGMLRLDYFDDAVGQVEGFQIFGDFMQHADLREKIREYDITEVLKMKLGAGKPKEIRTSLICLDIFRSFDHNGPWTRDLVKESLEYLNQPEWKVQKAGVTILSALAQTDHGAAAIRERIPEIVEMLLPVGYLIIPSGGPNTVPADATSPGEGVPQTETEADRPRAPTRAQTMSPDSPSKLPSTMLGPACALRILAQNKMLRECTRATLQYGSLKHLHLSGSLVDDTETSAWRVKTPNRADVIDMLDKMIKAVDEELSEEGLMSIGDAVLPHIQHWDRLAALLRDRAITVVTILPLVLGVSALAIIAVVIATPIYLSMKIYKAFKGLVVRYQNSRTLNRLREREGEEEDAHGRPATIQPEGGHEGEGPRSGRDEGVHGEGAGVAPEGEGEVGAQEDDGAQGGSNIASQG